MSNPLEPSPSPASADSAVSLAVAPVGPGSVVEYARQTTNQRPVSLLWSKVFLGTGIGTPLVGVAILLLFRATANDAFVNAGIGWLTIGGGLALTTLCTSATMIVLAKPSRVNGPVARRHYLIALIAAIAAFPIAYVCMSVGSSWAMGPHFRLQVYNDTPAAIDAVSVHFSGGDVTVGPIAPGTAAVSGLNWTGHRAGPISITTRVGNRSLKKVDQVYCDDDKLKRPYYVVRVEPHELPKP